MEEVINFYVVNNWSYILRELIKEIWDDNLFIKKFIIKPKDVIKNK